MNAKSGSLLMEDAAVLCGCEPSEITHLIELGLLPGDGLDREDINGIRLTLSLEKRVSACRSLRKRSKIGSCLWSSAAI